MKRTLIATVLTTLGLGLTINAQPGPAGTGDAGATDEIRGPGRQGPPPWAMGGGPGMMGPRWAQMDAEQQPDQEAAVPDRQGNPRRGLRGGPDGIPPRRVRPDGGQNTDQSDLAPGPNRQGPAPWLGRGLQSRPNRQAGPLGMNRGQGGQRQEAFQGPTAQRGQRVRQFLRDRLQNAPRNGIDRQGPPPWVARGNQFGAGRQGPPAWLNRGQGGQGPRAFAGPGAMRGRMMQQMMRHRLQNAPQGGPLMQSGVCPLCGSECGQQAGARPGLRANREATDARPGLEAGPRAPRGQMGMGPARGQGPRMGTGMGMGMRMGRQEGPGQAEMNAPERQRRLQQEQPDRPVRDQELRGPRGARRLPAQAPDRSEPPAPPQPEGAE
ncbi:MAG: hypothetical protein H7A46_11020 [Verrucomicrobiales bacterium]|nr:hypothetical protein [Verrucomicrobiales bacterium]